RPARTPSGRQLLESATLELPGWHPASRRGRAVDALAASLAVLPPSGHSCGAPRRKLAGSHCPPYLSLFDAVREIRPTFDPLAVTAELAAFLRGLPASTWSRPTSLRCPGVRGAPAPRRRGPAGPRSRSRRSTCRRCRCSRRGGRAAVMAATSAGDW